VRQPGDRQATPSKSALYIPCSGRHHAVLLRFRFSLSSRPSQPPATYSHVSYFGNGHVSVLRVLQLISLHIFFPHGLHRFCPPTATTAHRVFAPCRTTNTSPGFAPLRVHEGFKPPQVLSCTFCLPALMLLHLRPHDGRESARRSAAL
jgi:hypothetical protein